MKESDRRSEIEKKDEKMSVQPKRCFENANIVTST